MAKKSAVQSVKSPAAKLRPQVRKVLVEAAKLSKHVYLTAFQILDKLPPRVRSALIKNHMSEGGKNASVRYPASQVVKNSARYLTKDIIFLGTHGIEFMVNGKVVKPSGHEHIAAYRLLPPNKKMAAKGRTSRPRR